MWRYKKFHPIIRIIISLFYAIMFIGYVYDSIENKDYYDAQYESKVVFEESLRLLESEKKEKEYIKNNIELDIIKKESIDADIIKNHPENIKPNQYLEKNVYNTIVNSHNGSYINFGSYEQDGNYDNGDEPIEWIIIKKNDFECLLLSKDIIDLYENADFVKENMFNSNEKKCVAIISNVHSKQLQSYFPQPVSYFEGNKILRTKTVEALKKYDIRGFAIAPGYETETGYKHYYCSLDGWYETIATKRSRRHYFKLKDGEMGFRPIIVLNLRDVSYSKEDIEKEFLFN